MKIFCIRLFAIFIYTFLSVFSSVFVVDRLLQTEISLKVMFYCSLIAGTIQGLFAVSQELKNYIDKIYYNKEKKKRSGGNPHNKHNKFTLF